MRQKRCGLLCGSVIRIADPLPFVHPSGIGGVTGSHPFVEVSSFLYTSRYSIPAEVM